MFVYIGNLYKILLSVLVKYYYGVVEYNLLFWDIFFKWILDCYDYFIWGFFVKIVEFVRLGMCVWLLLEIFDYYNVIINVFIFV